ncbi:MAG: YadA-like family protein, partial [Ostreibacterium sp.]
NNATNVFGGNSTVNTDGSISVTNIGGTGKDNFNDAITEINQSVSASASGSFRIAGNSDITTGAAGQEIKTGEAFTIVGDAANTNFSQSDGGQNIYTQVSDNQITIGLANDIRVNSVQTNSVQIGDTTNNTTLTSTADGLDVGGDKITNVGDGTVSATSTDAVSGKQLYNALDGVNGGVTKSQIDSLHEQLNETRDESRAGTAAALAAASLPQPYEAGASMVGVALGTYHNESAISIGVSMISDDGSWIIKGALTQDTQNNTGAAVGVGYQW